MLVITPAHNEEGSIGTTLNALLAQSRVPELNQGWLRRTGGVKTLESKHSLKIPKRAVASLQAQKSVMQPNGWL